MLSLLVKARDLDYPADYLVRCQHNRVLPEGDKLWERVMACTPLGSVRFELPAGRGRKARPVEPTHDQEEAAVGASLAARAFALVSALASLPWLVIERLVDRALGTPAVAAAAAPVTKRSPSSEAPRADDASSAEEEGSE